MKRSEMVKKISKTLEFFHKNKFDEAFRYYDDYSEIILLDLEEAGMLPPAYIETYSDAPRPDLMPITEVNEWEPENGS